MVSKFCEIWTLHGNCLPDGPNSVRFYLTVWDMACMLTNPAHHSLHCYRYYLNISNRLYHPWTWMQKSSCYRCKWVNNGLNAEAFGDGSYAGIKISGLNNITWSSGQILTEPEWISWELIRFFVALISFFFFEKSCLIFFFLNVSFCSIQIYLS